MELGKVAGQVVATVRAQGLPHNSLLLVELIGSNGEPTGESHVAMDTIGAGEGEWVILVRGSSARKVMNSDPPLDLAVVGIVDQVSSRERTLYKKNG